MNLPDPKSAYSSVCRSRTPWRKHLHPVLYRAASETGFFEMRNSTEKQVLPVFSRNYEIALKRAASGEDLEISIPKGLPEEVSVKCSAKDNKSNLKNLRAQLAL